VEISALQDNKQ